MVVKARVVTPTLQVEAEADDLPELERLLDSLKARKILPEPQTEPHQLVAGKVRIPVKVGPLDQIGALKDPADPVMSALTQTPPGSPLALRAKLTPSSDGTERVTDAALVLIYGYEKIGETPVKGGRLLRSLNKTGYAIERVDRPLEPLRSEGLVTVSGAKRGRGYALSEPGKVRARSVASELLQQPERRQP
jgi:hypothetical protein